MRICGHSFPFFGFTSPGLVSLTLIHGGHPPQPACALTPRVQLFSAWMPFFLGSDTLFWVIERVDGFFAALRL